MYITNPNETSTCTHIHLDTNKKKLYMDSRTCFKYMYMRIFFFSFLPECHNPWHTFCFLYGLTEFFIIFFFMYIYLLFLLLASFHPDNEADFDLYDDERQSNAELYFEKKGLKGRLVFIFSWILGGCCFGMRGNYKFMRVIYTYWILPIY